MLLSIHVQYYGTVVRPTAELWRITATNLTNGNTAQAKRDVEYINRKWSEIGLRYNRSSEVKLWDNDYTIKDLLREIRERQ